MENICALVEEERFQEAHPLCKELLLRDPNNAAALEIMAIIIIEGGILYDPNVEDQVEVAFSCLLKSVEIEPNSSVTKYLYLGQLCAGKEALEFYEKALELLGKSLATAVDADMDEIKRKMAQVYTAMTELYMSDETLDLSKDHHDHDHDDKASSSFTDLAIKRCESFLSEALKLDPYSPETICCQAQFWLSVFGPEEKAEQVKSLLEQFLEKIYLAAEKDLPVAVVPPGPESSSEEIEDFQVTMEKTRIEALIKCLEYDSRLEMVKLLLECSCPASATLLLESLFAENDSPLELDYLSAMLTSQLDPISPENQEIIKDSLTCFVEKYNQARSYMAEDMVDTGELDQMYCNALEMLQQKQQQQSPMNDEMQMDHETDVGK